MSPAGVLVTPEGEQLLVLEARVTRFLAHLRVHPAGGGRSRSLLFHALNTPEPGFRRLRARLRWAPFAGSVPSMVMPATSPGNFPGTPVSQPMTRGASGEDHGGFGLANTHDR